MTTRSQRIGGVPSPASPADLAASGTRIVSAEPPVPAPGPSGARAQPPGLRPTWVEVDLSAVRDNVTALKRQAAAPRLMAVVKADGYGHGLLPSARAALAGGADWLAVALTEEGQALREAGIDAPVLVMTEPPAAAARALLEARLTPAVYSGGFLRALEAAAQHAPEPIGVHVKLDTGMRRVGVPQADWEDCLRRVRDAPHLRVAGIWSHFAVADEPDHPFIALQAAEFARGLEVARRLRVVPDVAHLCNSAGTLHLHEQHHDMVRPGLSIYGLEPAPGLAGSTALRPALSWWSRLSLVKRLSAGESVSYGLRWRSSEDTVLGTVPAGYADGVVRALSNRGRVLVRGRSRPIAGTVCMDQFLIDGGADNLAAGDEVCLLGRQGSEAVSADEWAALLGTINYEIVCGIGKRVPRVYLGDDRPTIAGQGSAPGDGA